MAFGDLVGGEDLMPEPATKGVVVVVVVAPPARVLLCSVVVWTSTQFHTCNITQPVCNSRF